MQATATRTNLFADRTKLALAAAGLLAATIAGTAALALNADSTDSAAARISAPVTSQAPAWRLAEINELPVAAAQSTRQMATWRFLEINELPVAPAVAPANFERQRFIEINQMAGDSQPLVAPEMATGTRS